MKTIGIVIKVLLQNILIVLAFFLLAPFISMLISPLPWWLFGILFVFVIGIYLLALFFSNAELFNWVKNDYVWSLCTGSITLFIFVVPSVMWVGHNNI